MHFTRLVCVIFFSLFLAGCVPTQNTPIASPTIPPGEKTTALLERLSALWQLTLTTRTWLLKPESCMIS
jgi:hypothetical protein